MVEEIENFYMSIDKAELAKEVPQMLDKNTGNELSYLTSLVKEHVNLLPPESQEVERMEGLRHLISGKPLKPIKKPPKSLAKFKYGCSGRVHDVRNALYINPVDIDWKGEVGHLYMTLGEPDKLENVSEIVDTNKGAELNIIQYFRSEYGHSLPEECLSRLKSLEFILQKPTILWNSGVINWKAELSTFYISVGRADKLKVIDDICATNRGIEAILLVRLLEKYAKVLHPQIAVRLRALKDIVEKPSTYRRMRDVNWRAELCAFFLTIGHPERLIDVDTMLENNKGMEGDLFAHLCDKYRLDTPESYSEHLVRIGKVVENERLGLEYEDSFEDLQLRGQNYDTNLTAEGLVAVHIIDLSLNRFRFLDFSHEMTWSINHVVALNLSGNLLVSLDGIDTCKQLRFLDCNDNLLTSMTALRGCRMLRHLKISGNRLTSLSLLTPDEIAIADDAEQHGKAMLDGRRSKKGAFRSSHASTFFQTHFGKAQHRQEIMQAMSMKDKQGSHQQVAAIMASAARSKHHFESNNVIYHEPTEIDYQKELEIFYSVTNMRDKLPSIPTLLQSALGAEMEMLKTMHEKYSSVGKNAEDAESEVHPYPEVVLNRLLQLVAILKCDTNKYPIVAVDAAVQDQETPPVINWKEELSIFYRAIGLHEKIDAGVIDTVLEHHEGHENVLVANILNKYKTNEEEKRKTDDPAASANSSSATIVPRCAERRLTECKEALEAWHAETSKHQASKTSWGFSFTSPKKETAPIVFQDSPRPDQGNASALASPSTSTSMVKTKQASATTTHDNSVSNLVTINQEENVLGVSASEQTISTESSDGSALERLGDAVDSKAMLHPAILREHKSPERKKIFDMPHLEYLNASENSSLENLEGLRFYSHLSLRHLELQQCNLHDDHLKELMDLPLIICTSTTIVYLT